MRYRLSLAELHAALAAFVDDLSNSSITIDELITATERLVLALLRDGWWISIAKAFLWPAVKLVYTGMIADFKTWSISITVDKAHKLASLLDAIRIPDEASLAIARAAEARPCITDKAMLSLASAPGLYFIAEADAPMFDHQPHISRFVWANEDGWTALTWGALENTVLVGNDEINNRMRAAVRAGTTCVMAKVDHDDLWATLNSIDMKEMGNMAIIVVLPEIRAASAQSDWFDPADELPSHFDGAWRQPLPPKPTGLDIKRHSSPRLEINPHEWASLSSALGLMSWFATCVKWLSLMRLPLDMLHNTGRWSARAADAMIFMRSLAPILPNLRHQMIRGDESYLHVMVDSARMAWGAFISPPDGRRIAIAGRIPSRYVVTSSTAREASGAKCATGAAIELGIPFSAAEYTVDSKCLQGSATSSSSSVEVANALKSFGSWQAQGLRLNWKHQGRAEGDHPMVDALSGSVSPVPRWVLNAHTASYLWDTTGPWNIQMCTDQTGTLCSRYTTNGIPTAERTAMLEAIKPNMALGWQGTLESYKPQPMDVVFSFPLWSEIPILLAKWRASPFHLILVAPAEPSGWWSPALQEVAKQAAVIRLGSSASRPPDDWRITHRDPRRLAAYVLRPDAVGGGAKSTPSKGRPKWWCRYMLTKDGDIHPLPGPPKHNPFAFGPLRSTKPATEEGPPPAVAVDLKTKLAFGPLRSGAKPQPNPLRATIERMEAVAGVEAGVTPLVHPPQATRTMARWARDMLTVQAGLPVQELDPAIAPVHGPALAAATATRAVKSNVGSSAPVRLAEMCLAFATHTGTQDHAWSPVQAEAFVLDMMQQRLSTHPPLGWNRIADAATCLSDASRIAAMSRAAGYPLPPYCGPRLSDWATDRGARARPEHSAAYPIHISWLLARVPPKRSPDRQVWEALFIMALFCLRTGIVYHLYSHMFVAYGRGYLLVWRHTHKRMRDDIADIDSLSRTGAMTAACHPLLDDIIRRGGPNRRLFPTVTSERMSQWIRRELPHVPPSFDIRVYGNRTAADGDAVNLGLPDELVCVLFWWKRPVKLMKSYYSSTNIELAYTFAERRLRLVYNFITPSMCDCRVPSRDLLDWTAPAVGRALPPLPSMQQLKEAMECVSDSLSLARRVRCELRTRRARTALGSETIRETVYGLLEGPCTRCKRDLGPEDDAAVCMVCDTMICNRCYPQFETANWWCAIHTAKRAAR